MQPSPSDDIEQREQRLEQVRTEAERRDAQGHREEAESAGKAGVDENAAGFLKPAPAREDEDADPVGSNDNGNG